MDYNWRKERSRFQFLSGMESAEPIITFPQESTFKPELTIACTQLDLSSKKSKDLVDSWVELLPKLVGVERIWFVSRVPQRLFDAACEVPNLRSLFVKWSGDGIKDLSAISKSPIEAFYIGSATQVTDLSPLFSSRNLKWLELHGLNRVSSINIPSQNDVVQGLLFSGGSSTKIKIQDLEFVSQLPSLRYLYLTGMQSKTSRLDCFTKLTKLEYLRLPHEFPTDELVKICAALPDCDHAIAPVKNTNERCKKCKFGTVVVLSNRPRRRFCRICDESEVLDYEAEFTSALEQRLRDDS